jgi:hypothetical protein
MSDQLLIPRLGRSEDPSLDQKICRSYIWLSFTCSVFVDYHQGGTGERGAFRQMVRLFFITRLRFTDSNYSRIDEGQESLIKAFESATGRDKNRCVVAKDLSIRSVGAF